MRRIIVDKIVLIRKIYEVMKNIKAALPNSWSLIEQYDGNYIFENSDKSFCVNVEFTPSCEYPYSISFLQIKGQFNKIGIEDNVYSTHSKISSDALIKAFEMMSFIDSKIM